MTKAIVIRPDKTIQEITVEGLEDKQAVVEGLIQPIDLKYGVTMYCNEEGSYQFGVEDVNWVAADVAGLGGRPEFMFGRPPLLGPVLLIGFDSKVGGDTDLPEAGRRWVKKVGREAGAEWIE